MASLVIAGPREEKYRSDCRVSLELKESGGLTVDIQSKIEKMYGDAIQVLATEVLAGLGVKHAKIILEDTGALPFALAARIETAVKRADPKLAKCYLPERIYDTREISAKGRFRRSRLYIPGNHPHLLINAGLYKADGVIFDLEDSVAPTEKDAARIMVRNALRSVDFNGAECMVRINPFPLGEEDLEVIVPQYVQLVMIPKCERAEDVLAVDRKIESILKNEKIKHQVLLMPVIESALGVLNAYEITTSSENVVAVTMGLEDYTADIGVERTAEGKESAWAQGYVLNAAKAARIQALDTVYSDVNDYEGLLKSTQNSKSLGFEGKGCIHPRQIPVVHQGFAPSDREIEKAQRIVLAYEEAEAKGKGVVALNSKMIDMPVVKRALYTVDSALSLGLIKKQWRDTHES